ncbi:hypothetical protein HanXRQr2_Chr16g0736691 [Helianthus annuus]|uniref:Uncharacterized protein n=1 Tax=Helianthus annuus TaxID=4232 RepID=A0A9K3DP85_HELAN|nr:hypothetical protein HanXRQr2_Chr16g0736691 [Helianthus annuus]
MRIPIVLFMRLKLIIYNLLLFPPFLSAVSFTYPNSQGGNNQAVLIYLRFIL